MAFSAGGTFLAVPSSNSPLCPGATINLTGNYSGAIGTAPVYSWSIIAPGGGVTVYPSQNINIPSAIAGTYIATLTVSTVLNGTTYNNSQTISVIVNPLPALSGASQAATVCVGSSASINLTGLLPNTTFTVNYSINSIAQTPISGLSASASGTSSFNTPPLSAANNGEILQITGITVTSSPSNCFKSFSQNVILAVWQTGSWIGAVSSDWNNPSNWCGGVPSSSTDVIILSSAPYQPVIGVAGGICRNITINSGASLTISGSNLLSVYGNWTNNGTFIPGYSTVTFSGISALSGASENSFYNLSIASAKSLTAPSSANINIAGNWSNSGTFNHNSGSVTFNGNDAQSINSGASSFNNFVITNTGGVCTVASNNITVLGIFSSNTGSTLDMATFALNVNNVEHLGTLLTQNTSATPITSGKIWGGIINYNNTSSAQTAISGTYNNLTISTPGGATASGNITVNGILNLSASNPSSTKGCLEMVTNYNGYPGTTTTNPIVSYILTMGADAITIGQGDVTGKIYRSSLVANTAYTFGNQYTTYAYTVAPTDVTVIVTIGTAYGQSGVWGDPLSVKRSYEMIPTGGSGARVAMNLHYLESELNGNTEDLLVTGDYDIGPDGSPLGDEHGRSSYDFSNNFIGLSGVPISYFIFDVITHNWRTVFNLHNYYTGYTVWDGSSSSSWMDDTNWSNGIPGTLMSAVIPDASSTPNDPILAPAQTIGGLQILSGGILNLNGQTLTIAGYNYNGLEDQSGLSNYNGSTVIITNSVTNTPIPISGIPHFDNLTINAAANVSINLNSHIYISVNFSNNGTFDAGTFDNTVEYNGTNQTVILPDGNHLYKNLTLSGSGSKTLPASDMTIDGDLSLSGIASVTPTNALIIAGNFTVGSGSVFTAGSLTHNIGGNFSCDGTFNSSGSTFILNGIEQQAIGGTVAAAFNNLTNSNTTATVTANVDISCTGSLTNSGMLDMSDYVLAVTGLVSNNGTVKTSSINFSPLPAGETWNGTVEYTAVGGSQTVVGGIFNNLSLYNSGGTNTAGGNITVNNGTLTTTAGGTLDMGIANILSGSGTFTNNGTIKTSVPSATSTIPLPSGKTWSGTIEYGALSGSQTVVGGTYYNVMLDNTSGINTAGGDIFINNNLTTSAGGTLDMGSAYILSGTGTFTNNGTLKTSVTTAISSTPLPEDITWTGTIEYGATDGAQTVVYGTYNNLKLDNTGGINVLSGNINVNGSFTSQSGGAFSTSYNLTFSGTTACGGIINASGGVVNYGISAVNILSGTYSTLALSGASVSFCGDIIVNSAFSSSGTVNLANNLTLNGTIACSSGSLNASFGIVEYTLVEGGQNIIPGTYNDLKIKNTSGINAACGNITVNGAFTTTAGGTMDMLTYQLLGTLYSLENNGIIETANTSANLIPAGKNWGGIIEYYGNISQKAVGGTFNTLVISGTGGAIATGNIVVTNDLRLNNNNPSSNQGLLEMASYTLNMGEAAITTGIGDVTGIVKRQHTFLGNIPYTFGSEFSSITFVNYPGSIKPGWLSCRITIGSSPEWRTQAVKRYYSFAKDGGDDRTIINLRYLDSELDVAEPVESNLVIWCAIGPSPDWNNITEVGKSNNDINNNWLSLAGGSIQGIAPSSSLDYKQISFSYSDVTKIIWTGLGVDGEDWALPGNWNGGVPSETDDVYIPAGAPFYPTKNSDVINFPAIINSLEIEEQASVTTNFDITIKGDAGAWINRGTFYPETRTVTFAPVSVENIVSISGTTNFNNLAIADNAYFQPLADAYILISGGLSAGSGSILDFTTTDNTIEYNGAFQTVINPIGPGSDKGYHNLIISGSGNKTLADNIIITNQLELSASTLFVGNKTLQYNKISINQGVLTTNNTSNIIITGDAVNSYIPDYLGTIRDLNNLTVNLTSADAVVYNLSNLHLKGILTLSSGTLNTNNNLTLLSTAAQTALISGSGTGNIIGNISVQRYIPGNSGYHYLSTPVTNATAGSLAAYGYGSPIWGQDYSTYTYGPISNFWRYDETNISEKIHSTGTIMNGWVSPAGANDFLNPLVGYILNINSGITAQLIGTAASGLYSINVTKTTSVNPDDDGWNLVGNPYPSPIDWDALNGWTKTNVNNAIYMFKTSDRYTGNYCSYINGVSCDGIISNIIPSMQAFWIKASADGILALDNRVRTEHLNTPFYKKQEIQKPLLRLSVKGVDNELISDNTVVYFDKQASDNFNSNFDAVKLFNSNLTACNLFTLSGDNQKLSINSLNEINYNPIVQLNFTTDIYGYYILKVKDFLNFDFFNSIYLEDLSAHKFIKLNPQTEYKFLYNINEPKQFVLHFNKNINNIESKIKDNIKIYSSENRINIINLNNDKYELFIYNIIGQEVESQKINNTDYISKVLEKGNYVVKIVSGNNIIVNKITVF